MHEQTLERRMNDGEERKEGTEAEVSAVQWHREGLCLKSCYS